MPAIAVLCAFLVVVFEDLISFQNVLFLAAAVLVGLAIRWKGHRAVLLLLAASVAVAYALNL